MGGTEVSEMASYKNLSGNSGVAGYETRGSSITVRFLDGASYLYDASRPGTQHVAAMVRFAELGRGLATYIARHVKKNYARKLA